MRAVVAYGRFGGTLGLLGHINIVRSGLQLRLHRVWGCSGLFILNDEKGVTERANLLPLLRSVLPGVGHPWKCGRRTQASWVQPHSMTAAEGLRLVCPWMEVGAGAK